MEFSRCARARVRAHLLRSRVTADVAGPTDLSKLNSVLAAVRTQEYCEQSVRVGDEVDVIQASHDIRRPDRVAEATLPVIKEHDACRS